MLIIYKHYPYKDALQKSYQHTFLQVSPIAAKNKSQVV